MFTIKQQTTKYRHRSHLLETSGIKKFDSIFSIAIALLLHPYAEL